MFALAAVQTAILGIPDLFRIATREYLRHQTVVIGGLIARMGVLKRLPVIGKDLLKDTPVPGGCCKAISRKTLTMLEWACSDDPPRMRTSTLCARSDHAHAPCHVGQPPVAQSVPNCRPAPSGIQHDRPHTARL